MSHLARKILTGPGGDGITWTDVFNGFNPGSTCTRNSLHSILDINGVYQQSPANVAGIEGATFTGSGWSAEGLVPQFTINGVAKYGAGFKGYRNDPAKTNFYFPSFAPVTKGITTTNAVQYTVSMTGSGSVTLSGTMTGTVTEGSSVTRTATGGTCTFTMAGEVLTCQMEAGAYATSPIYTLAGSAARPVTKLTRATAGALPSTDFGVWQRVFPKHTRAVTGTQYLWGEDGSVNYYAAMTTSTLSISINGVGRSVSLADTTTPFEWQGALNASGLTVRVKVDGGAWSAWSAFASPGALVPTANYKIGGISTSYSVVNIPFLAILTDPDPKAKLELAASLYPTS